MAVNIRLWRFLFYHTLPIESVTHKTVFLFRVCSPFKAHSNSFILSLFVQSYLKKLAPLCLLISRTHEGRKGAETPASETRHGFQSIYPLPPPPNLLTWQRCINLKQEYFCYMDLYLHEANDLILNSEQTRQTCLPKSRPGQDAAIFVLIRMIGILITKFLSFIHRLFSWRILC